MCISRIEDACNLLLCVSAALCLSHASAGRSMRGSTRRTYDQVNDVHDTRVPIYNEEAFQYGILFKAKVREQLWWRWQDRVACF